MLFSRERALAAKMAEQVRLRVGGVPNLESLLLYAHLSFKQKHELDRPRTAMLRGCEVFDLLYGCQKSTLKPPGLI